MMHSDTPRGSGAAPIDCETAVRRLWDFLDGRLPMVEREEVEAHLAACASCPPHFTFAGNLLRALAGTAASVRVPATEEARLRERVRAALARLGSEGADTER